MKIFSISLHEGFLGNLCGTSTRCNLPVCISKTVSVLKRIIGDLDE